MPNFRIYHINATINQHKSECEEHSHEPNLQLVVSVAHLAIHTGDNHATHDPKHQVKEQNRAENEKPAPKRVLIRIDQNFDIHDYHKCAKDKVAG